MMQNLRLEEGQEINLKLATLPKVTYVKFQPDHYSFSQIPDPKTTLEYTLRGYTVLTNNDRIQLQYNGQRFDVEVTELRTEAGRGSGVTAGCLIDTNVEVDFDEPLEAAPEKVFTTLQLNQVERGRVGTEAYAYYRLRLPDAQLGLRLELKCLSGDPNMYVSCSNDEPTMASHSSFLAAKSTPGQTQTLDIPPSKPGFALHHYIGVHGFKVAAEFELCAQQYAPDANASSSSSGSSSSGAGGHVLSKAPARGPANPTDQKCDNCRQYISAGAFTMHSMQCPRNNWFCPQCESVVPKRDKDNHAHCAVCFEVVAPADLDKHMALNHRRIACECGQEFEPSELDAHKRTACRLRRVECRWCKLQVPEADRAAHEEYCGGKSVECGRCSEPIVRRLMDVHLATVHGVNPCLDPNGERRKVGRPALGDPIEPEFSSSSSSAAAFGGGGGDDDDLMAAIAASEAHEEEERLLQAALQASMAESATAPVPPNAGKGQSSHSTAFSSSSSRPAASSSSSAPARAPAPAPAPARAPAREELACPYCTEQFDSEDTWARHLELCALQYE